jgi:MFS family permease
VGKTIEEERLVRGYSGRIFLTLSFGWVFLQMGRQVIPPMLPNIITDLEITSTQAGVSLTLLWGVYALSQYPSGRLSDQLSRKTLIVSGLCLSIVGLLVISGTVAYPMLLIGAGVMGLGIGLYPTAARALISDLFVQRRGQAFGLHTASGDLGNTIAAGLAVAAVAVATWQTAFLPVALLLGVTLIAIHFWSREEYIFTTATLEIQSTCRRLLGDVRLRWLLVSYMLFAFTWQSTTGFLPTFLQFEKGFSVGLASSGFAFLFLVGTLSKPVSGALGDQFGHTTIAIGSIVLGVGGLMGMIVAESTLLIFGGIGIFGAGLMAFPPVMQAFFMDLFPDASMGGDLGAMRTLYIGFGSLGPTYFGYMADTTSYTTAFVSLIACMLVCAGIIVVYELRS